MGKRGNKKKQKKRRLKKNYNKQEFREIYCQTCLICKHPDPSFCYSSMYKHEPKPFTYKVFNNLIDVNMIYQSQGRSLRSMSVEQFQNVVCRTGICFNGDAYASAGCDSVKTCYKEFMNQMGVVDAPFLHENAGALITFKNNKTKQTSMSYKKKQRKKKRKQKAKARVVYVSYPTFFSSQNDQFQTAIRKILYGDSDNQQDKDQELSTNNSRAAGTETKS